MDTVSPYRVMWMIVMFDLPVVEREERHAAAKFRTFLLDEGFSMAQFSVYMKHCAGAAKVDVEARRVAAAVPAGGRIDVITLTDRQYENIISFDGGARMPGAEMPAQLLLL